VTGTQESILKTKGAGKMIEAVEVHETQITKPVSVVLHEYNHDIKTRVMLEHPVLTGMWFGIGLALSGIALVILCWAIGLLLTIIGYTTVSNLMQ